MQDVPKPRLRLEPLEPREAPAALAYTADAGHTLVVTNTGPAAAITVSQDDLAGTLTVTGAGVAPAVFDGRHVGTVDVRLGDHGDTFQYRTRGDVRVAKRIAVEGGAGDATVAVRWADDGSTAYAGLDATLDGGTGNDAIGFRIGQLAGGASARVRADGGAGHSAVEGEALSPGPGGRLDVDLSAGAGNDTVQFQLDGRVAAAGPVNVSLKGGAGNDQLGASVIGRLGGPVNVTERGGGGSDQFYLQTNYAAGPGRVSARLIGGKGDDAFETPVEPATTDLTIVGGAGTNVSQVVPGVKQVNVQQSAPLSHADLDNGPPNPFYGILPTRTLAHDGRTVEYWAAGQSAPGRPAVVLLNGFGGTADDWDLVAGPLAAQSRVIAVNRPGYGATSPAAGDYAATATADLEAVIAAAAGGHPVVLVGHSLGGLYADLFARLRPDRVAGVVFVDSSAPEQFRLQQQAGLPTFIVDPTTPESRLQSVGYRQESQAALTLAKETLQAGAFPPVPVVSLRSEDSVTSFAGDPQLNAAYQALGALGRPGQSETRVVADAGHYIQWSDPAAVLDAVRDVVNRAGRDEPPVTLTAHSDTGVAGDPVTLTAAVPGTPAATGTVTFTLGSKPLGTAALVNGKATLTTDELPAGTDAVTASYSGDPLHAASRGAAAVRLAAPSADSRFISGVLAAVAKKYDIPGLTAAVIVNGRVITGAAGVRQAGTTAAVQTGDTFHLGSSTKAITATLAGILVDRGVISWDSTVDQVFPELKGKINPQFDSVTLRELLSHTAGVINDGDASPRAITAYLALAKADPRTARADITPVILNEKPTNPVGTFHYSNEGYVVAAAMIERVTGDSYEDLVRRDIFGPLGMATATFTDPNVGLPAAAATGVVGHDPANVPADGSGSDYEVNAIPIQDPAGANLNLSVGDWGKFVKAQLGETVNGVRLLEPATLAALHTGIVNIASFGAAEGFAGSQYGLGWFTCTPLLNGSPLGSAVWHQGDDGPWWLSEAVLYPDAGFATLTLSNRQQNATTGAVYQALTDSAYAEVRQALEAHFAPRARTTVALAAHPATGVAGNAVTLTATVSHGQAVSGAVTFTAGGKTLGTAPVVAGTATLTTTKLPAGASRVEAAYAAEPGHTLARAAVTVRLAS